MVPMRPDISTANCYECNQIGHFGRAYSPRLVGALQIPSLEAPRDSRGHVRDLLCVRRRLSAATSAHVAAASLRFGGKSDAKFDPCIL